MEDKGISSERGEGGINRRGCILMGEGGIGGVYTSGHGVENLSEKRVLAIFVGGTNEGRGINSF